MILCVQLDESEM